MQTLTTEQANALAQSEWWIGKPAHDIVMFQLFQERLCLPFPLYQAAVEEALGRPVYTHEFAKPELLQKEFLGDRQQPTFEEIMAMIPAEKRIIVAPPAPQEG